MSSPGPEIEARYAEYLFDTLHDKQMPPYRFHNLEGNRLTFTVDNPFVDIYQCPVIAFEISLDDTRETVSARLMAEWERIKEEETEKGPRYVFWESDDPNARSNQPQGYREPGEGYKFELLFI